MLQLCFNFCRRDEQVDDTRLEMIYRIEQELELDLEIHLSADSPRI